MDPRVERLDTPEKCEIFAKNATDRDRPDLAKEARHRAVQIRAAEHEANTDAEKEALQAVCAYEAALTRKNGKRTRASRTWQMIKRHGIINAVERAVNRPDGEQGFKALVEMGLDDFAFEAVVLRHPGEFSDELVEISRKRLSDWK